MPTRMSRLLPQAQMARTLPWPAFPAASGCHHWDGFPLKRLPNRRRDLKALIRCL